MKLLGISALAGSGKSTFAEVLVANGWCCMAFADPLKRFCQQVYGFSTESLWGSSELRNIPDKRYPVVVYGSENEGDDWESIQLGLSLEKRIEYLTPRKALQTLGDWGRNLYLNTWVDMTLNDAKKLSGKYYDYQYSPQLGCVENGRVMCNDLNPYKGVFITDVRMRNEFDAVHAAGGKIIRMRRKGIDTPAWNHISETEQMEIPDSEFDDHFQNVYDLTDPKQKKEFEEDVLAMVDVMYGG